jgi:hypothetical protein
VTRRRRLDELMSASSRREVVRRGPGRPRRAQAESADA